MSVTEFEAIRQTFLPVLERIAATAAEREREHRLPRAEIALLLDAGFAALRIPVSEGGAGLTFRDYARILSELARADSNIPQVFRGHIAFVEHVLGHKDDAWRRRWIERFVRGEFVGNAWTELRGKVGEVGTSLTRGSNGLVLSGVKNYTTGSIFADWIDVLATDEHGESVSVLVRRDANGVEVSDDWDGFGQQLTGSGTARFDEVLVDPAEVEAFSERFSYQTALYQFVLLSVLTGIARAVLRDAVEEVSARSRVYSHGNAARTADDSQIQAVVGEISSVAFTAEALLDAVAEELDRAAALELSATGTALSVELISQQQLRAEFAASRAQVVLSEQVPLAATRLFHTLGASATSRKLDLDRHWRNARTVASHNPVLFKARDIGAWELNGTAPELLWSVGTSGS